MAENKKSFILYADQIGVFSKLTDAKAGKLVKMIFEYVNDLDPQTDDTLLQIAFEPIKQALKRDLKDWEAKKVVKSSGGKIGNLKRWNPDLYEQVMNQTLSLEMAEIIAKNRKTSHSDNSESLSDKKIAVSVSDSVNVSDSVSVTIPPDQLFKIEECLLIALRDERWVNKNNVKREDLEQFNGVLEGRGQYSKNPAEYKSHYFNWVKDGRPGVEESGKNKSITPPGQLAETVKAIREQRLNG